MVPTYIKQAKNPIIPFIDQAKSIGDIALPEGAFLAITMSFESLILWIFEEEGRLFTHFFAFRHIEETVSIQKIICKRDTNFHVAILSLSMRISVSTKYTIYALLEKTIIDVSI